MLTQEIGSELYRKIKNVSFSEVMVNKNDLGYIYFYVCPTQDLQQFGPLRELEINKNLRNLC